MKSILEEITRIGGRRKLGQVFLKNTLIEIYEISLDSKNTSVRENITRYAKEKLNKKWYFHYLIDVVEMGDPDSHHNKKLLKEAWKLVPAVIATNDMSWKLKMLSRYAIQLAESGYKNKARKILERVEKKFHNLDKIQDRTSVVSNIVDTLDVLGMRERAMMRLKDHVIDVMNLIEKKHPLSVGIFSEISSLFYVLGEKEYIKTILRDAVTYYLSMESNIETLALNLLELALNAWIHEAPEIGNWIFELIDKKKNSLNKIENPRLLSKMMDMLVQACNMSHEIANIEITLDWLEILLKNANSPSTKMMILLSIMEILLDNKLYNDTIHHMIDQIKSFAAKHEIDESSKDFFLKYLDFSYNYNLGIDLELITTRYLEAIDRVKKKLLKDVYLKEISYKIMGLVHGKKNIQIISTLGPLINEISLIPLKVQILSDLVLLLNELSLIDEVYPIDHDEIKTVLNNTKSKIKKLLILKHLAKTRSAIYLYKKIPRN